MARRSSPSMSEATDRYIAHCFGRGGSSGVRYSQRSILRRLTTYVRDCQVGSVRADQIEDFFYGPEGLVNSCAASTLGKYYGDLRAFFLWCYRRKWCDDPERTMGGIRHTSTRVRRNRLRLSDAQMWAMVKAADNPRDAAMLVFAMQTGCRVSEILEPRVRDVNLSSGEVAVRILKTREEDVLKISPTLDKYLRSWLTAYHDRESPPPSARLFPAGRRPNFLNGVQTWQERGFNPEGRINNPGTIIRGMAAAANVELEDGDGWHTIRRSVARIFFDRASHMGHDAALRMTSAFLHHANTSTTEIYLGLQLEKAKRDQVMAGGFLEEPAEPASVTSLDTYREGGSHG